MTAVPRRRPPGAATGARSRGPARSGDTIDVTGQESPLADSAPRRRWIFATIQPMIFVLLFRYAFGGAIKVPGVSYVDFLMPGRVRAVGSPSARIGTAVGLFGRPAGPGCWIRFRTLPMSRIAVLAGRTLADLARNVLVIGGDGSASATWSVSAGPGRRGRACWRRSPW